MLSENKKKDSIFTCSVKSMCNTRMSFNYIFLNIFKYMFVSLDLHVIAKQLNLLLL